MVSLVTLASGREGHLLNLLAGLERGRRRPAEVVLVCLDGWRPPPGVGQGFGFPVREVPVAAPDSRLPLAAARNAGARAARSEKLVFLDVDCIPGPALVGTYSVGLDGFDGILMGEVRYLPPGAAEGFGRTAGYPVLLERSVPHPRRTRPPEGGPSPTERYEEFWSLSLAVGRRTFLEAVGGFDEGFTGYGAEDTDFAFTARRRGVPLAWIGDAVSLHQHHETYDPPLQHLGDIVRNARRFREKWGVWPMEGWLSGFARMGLVRWDPRGDRLSVLREPTPEEVEARRRREFVP